MLITNVLSDTHALFTYQAQLSKVRVDTQVMGTCKV